MFKVNELVIYGNNGICCVEDIKMIEMPCTDEKKLYYVLKPLYYDGKIYSPIDTNVFMRPIITYDTAQQLINQIPSMEEAEVYNNNSLRELNDYYKSMIETHNCEDLLQLIRVVYVKKSNADNNKKKLGQTDKNYMRIAEDLLYGEFAAALGISKEDVKSYIEFRVEELERQSKVI